MHDRTARAERHDHLRHAELGPDDRGLLLGELQDRHRAEELRIVVRVEHELSGSRGADEPLPVVGEAASAGELGERLRREVTPRERPLDSRQYLELVGKR